MPEDEKYYRVTQEFLDSIYAGKGHKKRGLNQKYRGIAANHYNYIQKCPTSARCRHYVPGNREYLIEVKKQKQIVIISDDTRKEEPIDSVI
mgnify:CR=1 FL=1